MEMTKKIVGVWMLVKLKGSLDAKTAPELDKVWSEELEKHLDIALDFSELEYISSMGLRSIMQAVKKTNENHHRVAICGMTGLVKEVIERAGIDGLVDVYEKMSDLPFIHDVVIDDKI